MITRGIRKQIDLFLGDLHIVAVAQMLANQRPHAVNSINYA
jgi:hypothetical protein